MACARWRWHADCRQARAQRGGVTMEPRNIEFFWDAASPYTYLAATQIEPVIARAGAKLLWRPFLLGKVFEATGNRMPASVPAKAKHLFCDVQRWAQHYGVPVAFPKVFPVNSVLT